MFFKNTIDLISKKASICSVVNVVSYILCMVVLLRSFSLSIQIIIENSADYTGYAKPEYMINYQSGFVRRGLLGEIFYQMFLIHPYPFHTVLVWFEALIFFVFIILSFRIITKLKFIPIMPYAIIVGTFAQYRRDFIMILMALMIYYYVIKYLKQHRTKHLFYFIAATIVAILIYEPSFFFIVPISMFLFYKYKDKEQCRSKRIQNTLMTFILPIIAMVVVCSAKGTTIQANAIWQSWLPLFDFLGIEQPKMPDAIQFLSMSESVLDVAKLHLKTNYGIGSICCKLGFAPRLVAGSFLFFTGMYFLTITTPLRESSIKLTKSISSVYLFQFLSLLPMFSILSCDFGRTILYVVFTSFYLVYLLKDNNIEINMWCLDNVSDKVIGRLSRVSSYRIFIVHLIVLILIPFDLYCGVKIQDLLFFQEFWPIIQSCISSTHSIFCL